MNTLTDILDWSQNATLELSRSSQALALHLADQLRGRLPDRGPRLIQAWLDALDDYVEDPVRLAARPYRFTEDLVSLHGEFVQRMLELVDAPHPQRPSTVAADAVVIDITSAFRRHASDC